MWPNTKFLFAKSKTCKRLNRLIFIMKPTYFICLFDLLQIFSLTEAKYICNWLQTEIQINEFPIFFPYLQYKKIIWKCNKASCCIITWSQLTLWFKLNFLMPRNEINLEHFRVFSWTISKICKIVLEYTLKCSQLISSSDNKKILLKTRNVRLDSGYYATKY